MSRALVVVDVQVGLVAEAYEGNAFLSRVVALRHRADAAGAATVFVQHDGDGELADVAGVIVTRAGKGQAGNVRRWLHTSQSALRSQQMRWALHVFMSSPGRRRIEG